MNRQQMLKEAARLHAEWSDRHADDVPARPSDSQPHDGENSDYAEHHADRSAPPQVDDELNRRLAALIESCNPSGWVGRTSDRLGER